MTVKSRPTSSAAYIKLNGKTLVNIVAGLVWLVGFGATIWVSSRMFPAIELGRIILYSFIAQVILSAFELKFVRQYFGLGSIPVLFFAVDTSLNALAALDIPYNINYGSVELFYKSITDSIAAYPWPVTVLIIGLCLYVAYKVATTPEEVIEIRRGD